MTIANTTIRFDHMTRAIDLLNGKHGMAKRKAGSTDSANLDSAIQIAKALALPRYCIVASWIVAQGIESFAEMQLSVFKIRDAVFGDSLGKAKPGESAESLTKRHADSLRVECLRAWGIAAAYRANDAARMDSTSNDVWKAVGQAMTRSADPLAYGAAIAHAIGAVKPKGKGKTPATPATPATQAESWEAHELRRLESVLQALADSRFNRTVTAKQFYDLALPALAPWRADV